MSFKSKISQAIIFSSIITLEVAAFAYFSEFGFDKKHLPIVIFIWALGITGVNFAIFVLTKQKLPEDKKISVNQEPSFSPFLIDHPEHIKLSITPEACKRDKIGFDKQDAVRSQKINEANVLIFTKDYRTIRLNKDEIRAFYLRLIESEYSFFKPGTHEIEIKITKKP